MDPLELAEAYGGRDLGHPVIQSERVEALIGRVLRRGERQRRPSGRGRKVLVTYARELPYPLGQRLVVRDDHAALASAAQVLLVLEAEDPDMPQGPPHATLVGAEHGLRRVLHYHYPAPFGSLHDGGPCRPGGPGRGVTSRPARG